MTVFSDLELETPEVLSKGLFPILILTSIADQERMKSYYSKNPEHRFNNLQLTENQILVECYSYHTNIPTDSKFEVIFLNNDVKNFMNVSAALEYVSYNRSFEVDIVPNGYTPLAIINFLEGKPEILNKLRPESEKRDFSKYDYICLTNREVVEKVLNELDK